MTAVRHPPVTQFPVVDDCLVVGGIPLPLLAEQVGSTPFYAYDRAAIARRIAAIREQLPPAIELHYAVKANPMPALVSHVAGLVDGLDVASARELTLVLDAGANPQHVSFAGPGKSMPELRQAIASGILLNAESTGEIERIARIGEALGIAPRIAVRVNPDFELKSSGMKMGGGPKQFGIDAEQVPAALDLIARLGLALEGFHVFWGSQNLDAAAICEAQRKSVDLAFRLGAGWREPIRSLNIGGGFGIPYFPGERSLALEPIGRNLHELGERVARESPSTTLILELGRYLVGEAGVYVCRVVDRKVSRGRTFLVTDGGLHHHLAASGNFGQVIRKNYPVVVGNRVVGRAREIASVVGPLCTPLDLLADGMELAEANVGDLIAVLQSGAYGPTASPSGFLSHPPPKEVLV